MYCTYLLLSVSINVNQTTTTTTKITHCSSLKNTKYNMLHVFVDPGTTSTNQRDRFTVCVKLRITTRVKCFYIHTPKGLLLGTPVQFLIAIIQSSNHMAVASMHLGVWSWSRQWSFLNTKNANFIKLRRF